MQFIHNALLGALVSLRGMAQAQAAAARKGEHIGPGRRTLYTYWSGARRIKYRGRPAYNRSRENARNLRNMMQEAARAEWRAHQAELDRQQQAEWDARRAAREAAHAA